MSTLLSDRLTALFGLFLATLFCGITPVVMFRIWSKRKQANFLDINVTKKKRRRFSVSYNSLLNVFMFFGGGVLLATCFVHLIPEVRSNFDNYFKNTNQTEEHDHLHDFSGLDHDHNGTEHGHDDHDDDHEHTHESSHDHGHEHAHGVPYVEIAICCGFFLIYLLEEIVHTFIGHNHDHRDNESTTDTVSSPQTISPSYSPTNNRMKSNLSLNQGNLPVNLISGTKRCETGCDSMEKGYINYGIDVKMDSATSEPTFPMFHTQSCDALVSSSSYPGSVGKLPALALPVTQKVLLPASVRFARGLITITAFSAHSVFDGVAIGLQESSSQIWTMFFAICVHKLVVAFAVGMELFEQTSSLTMTVVHMTLFSVMSPIGILIVIVTESSMAEGDSPVIIMLSAVATGTILYIVFFEILQRDRSKDDSKLTGFILYLSMIVGFASMVCITLFIVH
ncbi:Zinc transporter ZIP3 [Halotydeus destructor]|nr:Zinc transporter ZIP3 [Halotydeus destructor]